ncbi:T9SS type B sorting domain-containing protein [Flavobacterium sp. LS2P90]|uniref:T9SS type B sorting domain-containing protein n=1 Tax=Flavobacterium xylosi TaxID=3230415 RepID=A0ABW6HV97_9FLAO
MKKTLLIFFIFLSINCFAQFSKTHYIPPLTANSNLVEDHYLYISTPSTKDVNFKIIAIGGTVINGVVSNNLPYRLFIGQGDDTQLFTPKQTIGILKDKGYIIEAEDLIYANVRVNAGLNAIGGYNHAGGLVSKGNSALGNKFRLGAMLNPLLDPTLLNFATILSTENNTKITISNIPNGTILSDGTPISGPFDVTLNKNESYVLALENNNTSTSNSSKMIGALVESDKPVVVNSGSFCGSNNSLSGQGRDVGFDQIVPFSKTGKEYIFVKGLGTNEIERVLLIAHEDQTEIFINGSPTIAAKINKGEYYLIDGSQFINGNLHVKTSNNVFAYQSIGGLAPGYLANGAPNNPPANQNMFFVPPINCSTPSIVDNIPKIEEIGNTFYTGGLNIVTETGAVVLVNNYPITATANPVSGNSNFVSYTVTNLVGNITVKSTKQVYVSYFGTNGAATYGGYYSGFDLKPEIVSDKITVGTSSCIPNVILKISSLSSYDTFQWYQNDVEIFGATSNSFSPTTPGFYQVKGSISGCLSDVFSDKIPVSECPSNLDNDLANDNIDIDYDNDGILNCTESYGDLAINSQNPATGVVSIGSYSNSFTGTVVTSSPAAPTPFSGNTNGSFVTELLAGKGYSVAYNLNFGQPVNLKLSYVDTANLTELLNSNSEFIINSDLNKTVTVLNPTNQLLIDTNYDGIYESGVTQFSSFEIRFRLNGTTPLSAGTGTFKFHSYQTKSLKIKHKNLLDSVGNKATFKLTATCIPKDSDSDGIPDQLDLDSDNDGIPDLIEGKKNVKALTNTDTNLDGLDNAFEPGIIPFDTDTDGIPDYLDLDSDNDGINDLTESGSNSSDSDNDGILDGNTFGTNGLLNSLETSNDNGVFNYTIADTDSDGNKNYTDLDSDNDLCNDVIEAGFTDTNFDGLLGNNPITINTKGIVTSGTNGYTVPNLNYITAGLITVTTQPQNKSQCILQNVSFTIVSNADTFQWQVSNDGILWNNIANSSIYSNANTNSLLITAISASMNGYQYRVNLNKTGNSCGLTSTFATLTTLALPVVGNSIILKQCDNDTDGITDFNLTEKNNFISTNYSNEFFSYFTTLNGANTNDPAFKIGTPAAYRSGTGTVWARVENLNGCFSTSKINLIVSATQINATFHKNFTVCDDYVDALNDDKDGIATFNFSSVTANIQGILPSPSSAYTIKYYKNEADALAETNEITNTTTYRNVGYPNQQQIWVRVDSNLDNACFGLGNYVTLTVEKLPIAHAIPNYKECDEISNDGIFTFNTSTLQSILLSGQSNVTVTYCDQNNNPLPSPFPNSFATNSQIIKARVTNNTTNTNNAIPCYDETSITFIVDKHPVANAVVIPPACDDAAPSDTDGLNKFDTSSIESTILNGQVGMVVKYFDSNGNSLTSPLPNPFNTATQNVKVTVENPLNTTCTEQTILQFVVNSLPDININANGDDDELVCTNLPTFYVQLHAGIQNGIPPSNYTYLWKKDGIIIPRETQETLNVNAEGNYTVEVSTFSECSRTRTIKVTASDIAHLDTIKIIDLVDVNSITVYVTGQGQYEYSLDEPYGPFQLSNLFNNVPAGIHEVFINDKNGCGIVSQTIAVLGLPKYFTPNGDGYNDYWSVKGVNSNFNTNSIIFIYDRYGKLITKINTNSQGWDGTLNGYPLPADDYWYTVKLEDGREAKGHFSLKR